MYLSIGNDMAVRDKSIIGIFAKYNGKVITADMPKEFDKIITEE